MSVMKRMKVRFVTVKPSLNTVQLLSSAVSLSRKVGEVTKWNIWDDSNTHIIYVDKLNSD